MKSASGIAPGHVVAGKYRVEAALGRGATGKVWRCEQLGLGRQVAVKILNSDLAAREEAHARFVREARVAASLDHPSSVAVLDFGNDDGLLYLVMELVDGESLRARLARGPLPLARAVTITRDIADALAAAHRVRLVHRDIKPENVILPTGEQPAKVVDFGLAFIADADETQQLGRVTRDGAVAGTPAYMSPEQVRGGSIGPPSDVYSLGCVLYELIAGRPPFVGAVGEIMTRHAYAPPIGLRQLELHEPPPSALDELVLSMLSKSPSARPTATRVGTTLAPFQAADTKHAGRTSAPFIERAARAVETTTDSHAPIDADGQIEIGVIGELPSQLELALMASGIRAARWPANGVGAEHIVWAAGVPLDQLAMLASEGKAVVTDVAAGAASALPALIRAGVADAIVRPHEPDDLIRRIWRVHRLSALR